MGEVMRGLLDSHKDKAEFTKDYERISLQDLEYAVRECEGHIAQERQRIRTDIRKKKPPLPPAVNDRLSRMKREASAMIEKAEAMDDDQIREKEGLVSKANELLKDRDDMLEAKTAVEAMEPEEVCDICGTAYQGEDGDAAHRKFRIHAAYTEIRARIAELKERVEEREKLRREKKEEEFKKKRKEELEKSIADQEGKEKKGDKKDKD